ncbi:MAG: hypothetical protein ACE5DX_04845, partial [Candidatus Dojkabacteria bacterium]
LPAVNNYCIFGLEYIRIFQTHVTMAVTTGFVPIDNNNGDGGSRLLIVLIFVFGVLAVGVVVWLFSLNSNQSTETATGNTSPTPTILEGDTSPSTIPSITVPEVTELSQTYQLCNVSTALCYLTMQYPDEWETIEFEDETVSKVDFIVRGTRELTSGTSNVLMSLKLLIDGGDEYVAPQTVGTVRDVGGLKLEQIHLGSMTGIEPPPVYQISLSGANQLPLLIIELQFDPEFAYYKIDDQLIDEVFDTFDFDTK